MAQGRSYRVAGFEVQFPHEAYGVQKVFMNQVLKAIHNEENALLEAPTGCGKTLSLLCGALAWQDAQKQKKTAAEQLKKQKREAESTEVKPGTCLAPVKTSNQGAGEATSAEDVQEEHQEEIRVPKIYYATRTHSQIAQVVRELKRTAYKPKMTVLGSRPHYCINKTALRHKDGVDAACEEMLKDQQGCRFKKNAMTLSHALVKVHDIEDLAKIGSRHKACPYFASRHLAESADLIFCPYSYLLDPNIRKATKVQAADAILIFDEAHNIEDQAREAGSIDLDVDKLKKTFLGLHKASCCSSESDAYEPLKAAVLQVINWLLKLGEGGPEQGGFRSSSFERFERLWTGQQMLAALADAGLDPQAVEHLWTCYEKARAAEDKAGFNTEGDAANERVSSDVTNPRAGGAALGYVSGLLTTMRLLYGSYSEASSLPEDQQQQLTAVAGRKGVAGQAPPVKTVQMTGGDHVVDYRMAVHMWVDRDAGRNRDRFRDRYSAANDGTAEEFAAAAPGTTSTEWSMSLGIWCLNPCVVFRCLSDVARSVLLASGTLSPLDTFSGELGLNFHVKLEAPHVVDMHRQVMARVVSHGPDRRQLCATYKEADKLDYQDSLGRLVLEVVKVVPDGVLLFLPSYVLMDKLRDRWKATGVWSEIERLKHIVAEPRKAGDEFDAAIAQYYKAVQHDNGGLFMAVCRGKASEGIDFADGNARCVMVVGIPFPNVKDSKVGLKKDFNNASATARLGPASRPGALQQGMLGTAQPPRLLSGDQWYSQQAFRALNQAVGRCIRHRYDYGAILLVDERFRQPRHQQCLSKWVRGAIATAADTPKLTYELKAFFDGLEADPPSAAAASWQQQQKQAAALSKPGYEAESVQSKLGSEPAPVMHPSSSKLGSEAGAGVAGDAASSWAQCKPGYEAAVNTTKLGCEATGCGKADEAGCQALAAGALAATSKEDCAAAGGVQVSSRQQTTGQKGGFQQQWGQQQKGQQQQHPLSGPMDSFVVRQQQQQQQQGQCLQQPMPFQHKQQSWPQQQQLQHPQRWQQYQQQLWLQQQQQCKQQHLVKQQQPTWQHPQQAHQQQQQSCSERVTRAWEPGSGSVAGTPAQALEQPAAAAVEGSASAAAAAAAAAMLAVCPAAAGDKPPGGQQAMPHSAGGQQHPAQQSQLGPKSSRVMPVSLQPQQQHCHQAQPHQQQQQIWQHQVVPEKGQASERPVCCMGTLSGSAGHQPHHQQQAWTKPTGQLQQIADPNHVQCAEPPAAAEPVSAEEQQRDSGCISPKPSTSALTPVLAGPMDTGSPAAAAAVNASAAGLQQAAVDAGAVAGDIPTPSAAADDHPHKDTAAVPAAADAGVEHSDAATAAAEASSNEMRTATEAPSAAQPACGGMQATAAATPSIDHGNDPSAAADAAVPASHSSSLTTKSQLLGIPADVLQHWVSADVATFTQQLRRQGVPEAGAQGCDLQQLVCFGVMASFELATDICQQQQQQQWQEAQVSSSTNCSLAGFWHGWHSHVPLGLLAVAVAAGQPPSQQQQQRHQSPVAHQFQQVQGPWLKVMQSKRLLDNLCDIAGAYDEALDHITELQQDQAARQNQPPHWQVPQQQQQQPSWQQSSASAASGVQAWSNQQKPWQRQQHQFRNCDQQVEPQQHRQGWQQQQQQQPPCRPGVSLARGPAVHGANVSAAFNSGATSIGTAPGPAGIMQLSQSARQPKRAAHRSDKSQLAAQKRCKQMQSARLAAAVPPPKVSSTNIPAAKYGGDERQLQNNEDDDFV